MSDITGYQNDLKRRHDWRVYWLYDGDSLVYIGSTSDWQARLLVHAQNPTKPWRQDERIPRGSDWDRYEISESLTDKATAREYESAQIRDRQPLLNGTIEQLPSTMARRQEYLRKKGRWSVRVDINGNPL